MINMGFWNICFGKEVVIFTVYAPSFHLSNKCSALISKQNDPSYK